MEKEDQITGLATRAWEYRKQFGFSKSLPNEIRREAASLVRGGRSVNTLAKALGVNRNSIIGWSRKFDESAGRGDFSEVAVVDEKPNFEVRLTATVQGCRVEVTGPDFSLAQRLLGKIGS